MLGYYYSYSPLCYRLTSTLFALGIFARRSCGASGGWSKCLQSYQHTTYHVLAEFRNPRRQRQLYSPLHAISICPPHRSLARSLGLSNRLFFLILVFIIVIILIVVVIIVVVTVLG